MLSQDNPIKGSLFIDPSLSVPSSQFAENSPGLLSPNQPILSPLPQPEPTITLQVEEALDLINQPIYTKAEKQISIGKLLHSATSSGDYDTVYAFLNLKELESYMDVDVLDDDGGSLLIYASCFGYVDIAKLLIDKGAKLDVQDANGWPALMWATSNGHQSIVQYLLAHGASPGTKTAKGRTVLDIINHGLQNTDTVTKNSKLQEILSYNQHHKMRQSISSLSALSLNEYPDDDAMSFRSLTSMDLDRDLMGKGGERLELLGDELEMMLNSDNFGYHEDSLEEYTTDQFVWDQCLPDQMFVFSVSQMPHIIRTVVTTAQPSPTKEQRSVPANVLFLCSRFAHYFSTPDLLDDLLKGGIKAIADCVKAHFSEVKYLAFWIANCSQLLYYLKKDTSLVTATVDYQLSLSELIHEIYQLLVRNIQSKIEAELEPSILECDSIPGLSDESRFKDTKKSFLASLTSFGDDDTVLGNGSTSLRKRLSLRRRVPPTLGNRKRRSSPETITSILSKTLTVLQAYQVHPMLVHHVLSQLIYYITSELFNRILDTKKYCSRTRAIQIRMSVTVLEDWIRTHATTPIVQTLTSHFKSLLHLLQMLQCYSSHRSLTEFLETLQSVDTLTPLQLQLIAETYRYENDEPRVPEEVEAYIQQVADRVLERKFKHTENKDIRVVRDIDDEVTLRIQRRVSFLNPDTSRSNTPNRSGATSPTSNFNLRIPGSEQPSVNGSNTNSNQSSPPTHHLSIRVDPPTNPTTPNLDSSPLPPPSPTHSRENSNDSALLPFFQPNMFTVFKDPNHLLPFSVPTHSDMAQSWSLSISPTHSPHPNSDQTEAPDYVPIIDEATVLLLNQ